MEENRVIDITRSSFEVHKVVSPPHRSTLLKLKNRLKETFFPDDPLRQFKGQTIKKKLILGAQYFFPILEWCPNYRFHMFKSDIISGLTIASLAIPQVHFIFIVIFFLVLKLIHIVNILFFVFVVEMQGISYAKLANLPPIIGLCEYFFSFFFFDMLYSS